jgi:DnaJ family protein A protein 2
MGGDLYVRIKIKNDKIYERKGADLFTNKKITLLEALTGLSFPLKFLDDTTLNIVTMPGEIISPCNDSSIK